MFKAVYKIDLESCHSGMTYNIYYKPFAWFPFWRIKTSTINRERLKQIIAEKNSNPVFEGTLTQINAALNGGKIER